MAVEQAAVTSDDGLAAEVREAVQAALRATESLRHRAQRQAAEAARQAPLAARLFEAAGLRRADVALEPLPLLDETTSPLDASEIPPPPPDLEFRVPIWQFVPGAHDVPGHAKLRRPSYDFDGAFTSFEHEEPDQRIARATKQNGALATFAT